MISLDRARIAFPAPLPYSLQVRLGLKSIPNNSRLSGFPFFKGLESVAQWKEEACQAAVKKLVPGKAFFDFAAHKVRVISGEEDRLLRLEVESLVLPVGSLGGPERLPPIEVLSRQHCLEWEASGSHFENHYRVEIFRPKNIAAVTDEYLRQLQSSDLGAEALKTFLGKRGHDVCFFCAGLMAGTPAYLPVEDKSCEPPIAGQNIDSLRTIDCEGYYIHDHDGRDFTWIPGPRLVSQTTRVEIPFSVALRGTTGFQDGEPVLRLDPCLTPDQIVRYCNRKNIALANYETEFKRDAKILLDDLLPAFPRSRLMLHPRLCEVSSEYSSRVSAVDIQTNTQADAQLALPGAIKESVRVSCPAGIHGRVALRITRILEAYPAAQVTLISAKRNADCRSLMALTLVEAAEGAEVLLLGMGEGANSAIAEIKRVLAPVS